MLVLKNYLNGQEVLTIKKEGGKMEFMGYLALPAFVFALAALAQANNLKKKIDQLEKELSQLNNQ